MHSTPHSNESLTDNLFMCLSLFLSIIHTLCISSQLCFDGYAYRTYVCTLFGSLCSSHCSVYSVTQYLIRSYLTLFSNPIPHLLACSPSGHRNSCSTPNHRLMQRVIGTHEHTDTHTVQLREHTYIRRSMYTCNYILLQYE